MTDSDPKETEGSGGGDGGGKMPPPGKDQENGYDIREDVNQKIDNLFADLDDDEDVVDAPEDEEAVVDVPADEEAVVEVPADEEAVVDVPADEEAVVDIPADDEAVVDLPVDDEAVVDLPADEDTDPPPPTEAVKPGPPPDTGGKPKKGEGVSPLPENKKPKAAVKTHPPQRKQPAPRTAGLKARKPLTSRILVWGAVLILIALTVRYFVTYSAEELARPPAGKPGLLFHKIVPVPSPLARNIPAGKPEPAPPVAKSTPTPPATSPKQAASPPKVSAPAVKSTGTVKAYVPQSYPYAIHVASSKFRKEAEKNLLHYHRGIQAYLVRTDLGKKGVWYRLFLGHFPSATAAVEAIKKYNFVGALVSRTRYACLLGSYPSIAQAEAATQRLAVKGFFPYPIILGGTYHLFVGAHPTRAAAEALSRDLFAAGFPSKLIER